MPTEIHFAGGDEPLRVDEEPSQVYEAWNAAQGLPFRVTIRAGRVDVYVNPAMVTFWLAWAPPPEFRVPLSRPPSRSG
jgi:hypothetical protein